METNRLIRFGVGYEILGELLKLPPGCKVVSVNDLRGRNYAIRQFEVTVGGDQFDPVEPGEEIPEKVPHFHRYAEWD